MATLTYEPLDELRREIRLAKLFPKETTPEICLSLSKASLNDDLEFTALSYTWGDANDTLPITIDGCPFQATRNLVAVLRRLQEDDKTVTLWIDAICIQQSNNAEKSWQIQLMKDIYEKATTTVVWLGEDPESAEVMRAFSHMFQKGMLWDYRLLDRPEVVQWLQSPQGPLGGRIGGPEQVALKKLLNLDYWFRVWCLQEFLVSQQIVVTCGSYKVPSDDFHRFTLTFLKAFSGQLYDAASRQDLLTIANNNPVGSPGNVAGLGHGATRMFQQRERYRSSKSGMSEQPLLDLLILAFSHDATDSSLHSTDPRDRVFGLLNLASDANELGIRPNYDKSCEDVFLETWAAILAKGQAALLVYPQYGRPYTASPIDTSSHGSLYPEFGRPRPRPKSPTGSELPSWVPDWRVTRDPSPANANIDKPFTVCGSKTTTQWVPCSNIRAIALRGVEVGMVGKVGTTLVPMGDYLQQGFKPANTFFTEIALFIQESCAAHPDTPIYPDLEAAASLWRIPVGDQEAISPTSSHWQRATIVSRERFVSMLEVIKAFDSGIQLRAPTSALQVSMTVLQNMGKFDLYLASVMMNAGRKPFLSAGGHVGLGPAAMDSGDIIVIFYGAHVPFVLRPKGQEFQLLGEAYVHGIMDGEFMRVDREDKTFHLC
ncbi:ATP-grasp domain-containing protein [Fusarium sp. Ph1]|nr:ATP-grasp domain-containing protein [Fusarium sp. Ph1]